MPDSLKMPRRLASAGFAMSVRRLLGLPYFDTQCGAKVMRRESLERILPQVTLSDLSFDVDLLLAAREQRQHIVEVPTVWIDRDGSRVNALHDTRRMGGSLLKLWARERGFTGRRLAGRVEVSRARG